MPHLALLLYLVHEAPPEERNYATLMEMLRAGEVREDDDDYASVLDELFDRLEMRTLATSRSNTTAATAPARPRRSNPSR